MGLSPIGEREEEGVLTVTLTFCKINMKFMLSNEEVIMISGI